MNNKRGRYNRRRASSFRRREQNVNVIELVDDQGQITRDVRYGSMATTSHVSVLNALTEHSNRLRSNRGNSTSSDDLLTSWAINETGTVDATLFMDSRENDEQCTAIEQQERRRVWEVGVSNNVLRIHGTAPGLKGEGIPRLIYENVNGLNNRLMDNEKVERARELHDELEVDIAAYNEHRLNMAHKLNINGFNQLFKGGEAEVRSVVSHNVHENIGRVQEGGTSLLMFRTITDHILRDEPMKDETGLSRWSVMTIAGAGIQTRVVCGYNPCYNKNPDNGTTYQQHCRYFQTRNEDRCPRTLFKEHLIDQLKKWRESGDRLVVCMDVNEHIYKKSIWRELTDPEGLAIQEVVGEFTQRPIGTTFFRGSKPIDGVWASSDIAISNAGVMPAGNGIGDPQLFVIDMATRDLVGEAPPKVIRLASRRLNTKLPGVANAYADLLEEQIIRHRLIEQTGEAHKKSRSNRGLQRRLNCLDAELGRYMSYAEKKCQRIKSDRILFSPEAALWIRRTQVYRSLLHFYAGRIRNRGNLKRTACRCGIEAPFGLSIREIYLWLKTCTAQCDYYRKHGSYYRRKHLYSRLSAAREKEDEEAAGQILAIIQREKERKYWRRMNYALGKPRGGACFKVQVENADGTVEEYTGQGELEKAIWDNIHRKRFILA